LAGPNFLSQKRASQGRPDQSTPYLQDGPGYPVLDGQGHFKSGDWLVRVRALDPWYTLLMNRIAARGWRGADDESILQGTQTYRTDLAFRAVSAWMRGLGWGTRKTNHALRAYAGSQIAMKYGSYDAQVWLRHSSVTVTEGHYHQYVADFKPANQDDIPARWATLERPELQLRVLPQLA